MILKEKDFTYEYVNYLNINHMMFCFCKILHRLTNKNYEYYLLNKPRQVISSVEDKLGRITVRDLINTEARIKPQKIKNLLRILSAKNPKTG